MRGLCITLLLSLSLLNSACLSTESKVSEASLKPPLWAEPLEQEFRSIEKSFPAGLGIYFQDHETNTEVGVNFNKMWYFSSAVKVPIAIEVLRQIELGKIKYEQTIPFQTSMRRDGAGPTSFLKPGHPMSVRFLLEQMLWESDNAASDILIDLVGLENINKTLLALVPQDMNPILTLLDVRHQAYAELHPKAQQLSAEDFIKLKAQKSVKARYKLFAKMIKVPVSQLKYPSIEEAFEAYYHKKPNSGSLQAYGLMLRKAAEGKAVSAFVSKELIQWMSQCRTGGHRLKEHFPANVTFAHKTGTQIRRLCDMGVVILPNKKKYTLLACAEKFNNFAQAEAALSKAGAAVMRALSVLPPAQKKN